MASRIFLAAWIFAVGALLLAGGVAAVPQGTVRLSSLNKYEVVTPVNKHDLQNTREHQTLLANTFTEHGHPVHADFASFSFYAFDKLFELELELNKDLISSRFVRVDGGEIVQHGAENCYYMGHVKGLAGSGVSLSTCEKGSLFGVIWAKDERYVIEAAHKHEDYVLQSTEKTLQANPASSATPTRGLREHIVYRMSDVKPESIKPGRCGVEEQHHKNRRHDDKAAPPNMDELLGDIAEDVLNSPANRKLLQVTVYYNEAVLVNDLEQISNMGGATAATTRAINIMNAAAVLYRKLIPARLYIVPSLVGIENFNATSQTRVDGVLPNATTDITDYLSAFTTEYVSRNVPNGPLRHDNAQLITGFDLSSPISGISWVGTMCSSLAYGIAEDASGSFTWTSVTSAHEMGHNFGCVHDNVGNSCPQYGYIMQAIGVSVPGQSSPSPLNWSACSVGYILSGLQALGSDNCLLNFPRARIGAPDICGDLVVEANEQCEPVLTPLLCTSNCTFLPGVVCGSGGCCSPTGQIEPAGTLCRAAADGCDIPEYCNGTSTACPVDLFKPDNISCSDTGPYGRCYQGTCMGTDAQCIAITTEYSYVGGIWGSGTCSINCVQLQCKSPNDGECFYLTTPTGQAVGIDQYTPCGPNSTCVNKVCTPLATPLSCLNGCSGLGTCTSAGCDCQHGWMGADCSTPLPCDTNCTQLFRSMCAPVESTSCGSCLYGYTTAVPTANSYTACDLYYPTGLTGSVVASKGAIGAANSASMATDGNPDTIWIANVTQGQDAYFVQVFSSPFDVEYYQITISSVVAAAPSTWILEASNNNITWVTVDTQKNIVFGGPSETVTFQVANPGEYTMYKFDVLTVANPSIAQVQIANINFYTLASTSPPQAASKSSSGGSGGAVAGAVVAVLAVLAGVGVAGYYYQKRKRSQKTISTNTSTTSMDLPSLVQQNSTLNSPPTISTKHATPLSPLPASSSVQQKPAFAVPSRPVPVTPSFQQQPATTSSRPAFAIPSRPVPVTPSFQQQPATTSPRPAIAIPSRPVPVTPLSQNAAPNLVNSRPIPVQNQFQQPQAAPRPASPRLPAGWAEYYNDDGIPYYYNLSTGVTQWERPAA